MSKKKLWLCACIAGVCVVAIAVTLRLTLIKPDKSGSHLVIESSDPSVTRGELKLKLVRERLRTVTLDGDGFKVPNTYNQSVDFTNLQSNIFGIDSKTLIGPDCYFEADMAISNSENYDFEYWLEIKPIGGSKLLSDQLRLTVTVAGTVAEDRILGNGLATNSIAVVSGSEISRFTVRLTYEDTENNNDTQNSTLAFDLAVHARLK